jgi:RND family efflux transporter MFP subunit
MARLREALMGSRDRPAQARHLPTAIVQAATTCIVVAAASCIGCTRSGDTHAVTNTAATDRPVLRPVSVTVAPVQIRPVERHISVVGTLYGFEHFTISPKVEGRVETIRVDVGDRVPPRATLLELDATDYRLAVEEAQRALEQELAKLGVQQVPNESFDVESNPGVVRARLLLENAQQQFDRQKKLVSSNASSAQAYEKAETDLKVAQAALQQARLDIQATLAAVRHKQAVLEQARQKLAETQVVAPRFDPGPSFPSQDVKYVVVKRMVSIGEMVRAFPSTPVLELVLDDLLKFRATVPERFGSQVREGQVVTLRVDAWPDDLFPARLSRVNPAVDPQSRTFEIEALVPNFDHRLKHGGFAKAAIITQASDDALTVPLESLVNFAGVTKVFRIRDGQAEEVVIKTGARGDGWVEALGSLQPQDLVATSGQSRLSNGSLVELRQTEARTAALSQR